MRNSLHNSNSSQDNFDLMLTKHRQIELEALEKAIQEGLEAYDKMQGELVKARASLTKILTSKDAKVTVDKNDDIYEVCHRVFKQNDKSIHIQPRYCLKCGSYCELESLHAAVGCRMQYCRNKFESNIPYSIITFVLLIFWIFRHPLYYRLCDGRTREVRPKISCSSKVDVMSS
ncbi:hypothetical protein GLYMA_05G077300v4 [Glycine max]|uniref:Uncharacterized protein n=2 Tax=Glycine subgen. Soja TaxID=1462606 RepID=A0A0R0JXS5_SOYBN|nr:uncharacterized protein LOC114412309 isoform X3 [Glycine soja]KAH1133282.1 hypothetical protein GYH30_011921 [Glycine max]KRH57673.1 hypothetical protein GLYMA_05G077300v4 [Glycine max]RZC11470.1 hypothetical protein D0Y65_011594 [Glycine soja]